MDSSSISHQMALHRHAQPGETDPGQIFARVANTLGRTPAQIRTFETALHEGLLPGGRILANAGARAPRGPGLIAPTLANCFVHPLGAGAPGLRLALHQIRRTLVSGGGVGLDLSASAAQATPARGPLTRTLRILERLAGRLEREGARPAALLGALPVDHPAVRALIHAKQVQALPHFNLSVSVSDAFLRSVRHDPTARALWLELATAALDCGDPGVLYIDTIQRADNLGHSERITACNPCGEQPLPPWGACLLASIDLTRVIRAPFTRAACVDWAALERLSRTGVALLDEALEHCAFPWPQQAVLARQQRRLGLGLLGLADALILLGLRYDQPQGRTTAADIMRTIQCAAWAASNERARRLGPCPASHPEHLLWPGHSASRLPPALQAAIRRHGVRNTHLTCIAPTGTLSLAWADNASPGIEPVFSPEGGRPHCTPQGELSLLAVTSPALRRWRTQVERRHDAERRSPVPGSERPYPPAWITRDETDPAAQVAMVGALQPWVDGGISKTLTLGPHCTPAEVSHWLRLAWRCGLKGLTVYQDRREARGRLAACTCTPASLATG